jgi:hypothetical protein
MKHFSLLAICTILSLGIVYPGFSQSNYDPDLVELSNLNYNGTDYFLAHMKRPKGPGLKPKAKYFASEMLGQTVFERFKEWSKGRNIILYTSGTYMNELDRGVNTKPLGLTIDNGAIVNQEFISNAYDGIVIVYNGGAQQGGIAISNSKLGNLSLSACGNISKGSYNLRNSFELEKVKKWAECAEATMFQSHLFAFKDNHMVYPRGDAATERARRRFLAICTDWEKNVIHLVIHIAEEKTTYKASKDVLELLNDYYGYDVVGLINLDTGAQDVFQGYNADGTENRILKGEMEVDQSRNLLVYYYD